MSIVFRPEQTIRVRLQWTETSIREAVVLVEPGDYTVDNVSDLLELLGADDDSTEVDSGLLDDSLTIDVIGVLP